MAYLKKEYEELIKRIDKELRVPHGWYSFVKKEQEKQNLIIKEKNVCTCNNCKTEFKSNKRINEYEKCPKCHNVYLIKQGNYSWHIFEKVLVLVDRLDDKWVIRLYEIFTRYSKDFLIYHSKPAEYGRIILDKNMKTIVELANDRLKRNIWGITYISHTNEGKKWREYGNYYRYLEPYGKVYHKNLKKLLENTKLKYSLLWELAKKNDEIDIRYHLCKNFPTTEMLIKMKLYKLAIYSGDFMKGNSFKERFGIEKDYYEFMKKYNIDEHELDVLKIYRKKDIEGLRTLSQFYINDLKEISKYIKLEKFVNYVKGKKNFDIKMYIDYLGFLEKLKFDLKDKKYIFPKNLKEKHDEYSQKIMIKNNQKVNREIKRRYRQLKNNIYSNKIYIIKPAESFISLEDESKQQNHCIRNYAEKYAKGKCDIYFMRELKEPEKSLVTIEVVDGKIVQSRIKNNDLPNISQKRFMKKWENEVLKAA